MNHSRGVSVSCFGWIFCWKVKLQPEWSFMVYFKRFSSGMRQYTTLSSVKETLENLGWSISCKWYLLASELCLCNFSTTYSFLILGQINILLSFYLILHYMPFGLLMFTFSKLFFWNVSFFKIICFFQVILSSKAVLCSVPGDLTSHLSEF